MHKEIQVCLQVHTCLPLLMDTEAHEARAFATICVCRAGVKHVSLSPGTHVFVSVWKYMWTSMSELQLGRVGVSVCGCMYVRGCLHVLGCVCESVYIHVCLCESVCLSVCVYVRVL